MAHGVGVRLVDRVPVVRARRCGTCRRRPSRRRARTPPRCRSPRRRASGCAAALQPLKSPTTDTAAALGAKTPKETPDAPSTVARMRAEALPEPDVGALVEEVEVVGRQARRVVSGTRPRARPNPSVVSRPGHLLRRPAVYRGARPSGIMRRHGRDRHRRLRRPLRDGQREDGARPRPRHRALPGPRGHRRPVGGPRRGRGSRRHAARHPGLRLDRRGPARAAGEARLLRRRRRDLGRPPDAGPARAARRGDRGEHVGRQRPPRVPLRRPGARRGRAPQGRHDPRRPQDRRPARSSTSGAGRS